jgi:hypothetical protein
MILKQYKTWLADLSCKTPYLLSYACCRCLADCVCWRLAWSPCWSAPPGVFPMCAPPTPPGACPTPPAGSAPPGFSLDSSTWSSYFGVVLSVVKNWSGWFYWIVKNYVCVFHLLASIASSDYAAQWHFILAHLHLVCWQHTNDSSHALMCELCACMFSFDVLRYFLQWEAW